MFLREAGGVGSFLMNFCPYKPPKEVSQKGGAYQNWCIFGTVAVVGLGCFWYYRSRPVQGVVLEGNGQSYCNPNIPPLPGAPAYIRIEQCVVKENGPGIPKGEKQVPSSLSSAPPRSRAEWLRVTQTGLRDLSTQEVEVSEPSASRSSQSSSVFSHRSSWVPVPHSNDVEPIDEPHLN